MLRILLVPVFFLAKTLPSISQVSIAVAPELGYASAFIPKTQQKGGSNTADWTRQPVRSPLLGIITRIEIKKHLYFTLGLQYQKTGERYIYHEEFLENIGPTTSDIEEFQFYHKMSAPATIGWSLGKKDTRFSVFAGYRANYFIAGKYLYNYNYDCSDNLYDQIVSKDLDPFDASEFEVHLKRYQHQITGGLSAGYKNFELTAMFSAGRRLYFSEVRYFMCFDPGVYFINTDLTFSLRYYFKLKKKPDCNCPGVK